MRFAALSALLGVASVISAPSAGAAVGDPVTYSVSSDGPVSAITYYDEAGTMQIVTNPPVPWSLTYTITDASKSIIVIGVSATGQKVSCQIMAAGVVRDSESASGKDNPASCIAPNL